MKLEFEMKIFKKFLILSKKRYMWQACNREGTLSKEVGKKGVLLARRDNSLFLRNAYRELAEMIFDKQDESSIKQHLKDKIDKLFFGQIEVDQFVITKSVGEFNTDFKEETSMIGSYKVKCLPIDQKDKEIALQGKTEREFYIGNCPAQVRLAERLRLRGFPVESGSRIEFVVLDRVDARTLGDKIEEVEYFKERKRQLKIDPLYYLTSLTKPLNQLFEAGIGLKNFMKQEEKYRIQYFKVVNELREIFRPNVQRKF
jgi:DNA polymerase elongation subunit (family B)